MTSVEEAADSLIEKFTKLGRTIGKASPVQQVLIGGIAGWSVGFAGVKCGKTIALSIGVGLLAFQLLTYENGRRSISERIKKKAKSLSDKVDREVFNSDQDVIDLPTKEQVKQFFRDHSILVSGFAAGLLVGVGTS